MPLISPSVTVTDWTSFTPSGAWTTNTTYTGFVRRVGDTQEGIWLISLSGAPTAATLTLNIPNGLTVDEAKLVGTTTQPTVGHGFVADSGTANYASVVRYDFSANNLLVTANGSTTSILSVSQTVPFTWANNDFLSLRTYIPISGW